VNQGRTIFSQLISFLPDREFRRCVSRYGGEARLRGFSCWDQYLAMAFAQLTYRESLRDIEACLRALGGKLYHLGFRSRVARSTLADANEAHDWRIFADFAQVLIRIARPLHARDPMGVPQAPHQRRTHPRLPLMNDTSLNGRGRDGKSAAASRTARVNDALTPSHRRMPPC